MDPPSFFHHPPRYVPHSNLPPPYPSYLSPPPRHPSPPPYLSPPHPYHPLSRHSPSTYNFSDNYPLRYSPPPPRVRVSHELGPSIRFRDDYNNQLTHNYTEEFSTCVNIDRGHHRHGADYYEPISRNYDYTPVFRNNIVKNDIHDAQHNRIVNSDVSHDYIPVFRDNLVEIDTHSAHDGFGNIDVGLSGLGRDFYGSSSDFGFRGRKEIFKSPKKVVQKKSALHRIQFSKSQVRNNRIEEHHFPSSCSGELDPQSIRNRGSNRVEEEKKRNPVELDVSFKSNSLVAKAVEVEGSSNSTPKKRKISNVSSSPSKKSSDGRLNLKKKSVRLMSYVSMPERGEHFEPTKEHRPVRSILVTPPRDEADIILNDKNASASTEEDVYVDIGGSPIHNAEGKRKSSPHLSSALSAKRTGIDESTLSGDGSDDSHTVQSCGDTSVEAQVSTSLDKHNNSRTIIASPEASLSVGGNVDTDLPRLVETNVQEGHMNLYDMSSDVHKSWDLIKEPMKTTIIDINTVDSVSKSNNAILVPEIFSAKGFPVVITSGGGNSPVDFTELGTSTNREEGEIESNLVTPSAIDMFLKEVSEATHVDKTLSSQVKDHISLEDQMVSGINKDGVSPFPLLSVNSCDNDYSSGNANEFSLKSRNVGKDVTSVSSSPLLYEEGCSVSVGTFTSIEELPANTDGEDRDAGCKFDILSSNKSTPCSESNFSLLENIGAGSSSDIVLANVDLTENSPKGEKRSFKTIASDEKRSDGTEFDSAETIEEQEVLCSKSFQQRTPLETDKDIYQIQPVSDMECDCYRPQDSLPSPPADLLVYTDENGSHFTKLCEKSVESESETLPVHTESLMLNMETEFGQISGGRGCEDSSKQVEKPPAEGSSVTRSIPTLQSTSISKSGHAVGTVNSLNSIKVGINASKNLSTTVIPSVYQMKSSLKKTIPPTTQFSKPRTWQRSSSSSTSSIPPKPTYPSSVYHRAQPSSVTRNVPSVAYVRKGNSLVRKAPSEAVIPKASHALDSSISWLGMDKTKKIIVKESKLHFNSLQSSSKTESNATLERPQTLALSSSSKSSICENSNPYAESGTLAPSTDPPQIVSSKIELDPMKTEKNIDSLKPANDDPEFSGSREYSANQIDSSENQGLDDGNLVSTMIRKVEYVKRKANQLIAASSSGDLPAHNADKTEALSSGGYFKRRKNQLVRKSMEIGFKVGMPDENLISESKSASQVITSSFQRRTGKGLGKTCRPSRSLVWTPHNADSVNKETSLLTHVWPHLFPWKRATYRRRFTNNQASAAKNGSSSWIRKLLLSRQRKTIYKRSSHGLSLRISKVLSVGGPSLKWSKSIEKNRKKANEEATLAVAAVERKKREKGVVTDVTARTKSRSHASRKLVHNIKLRPGARIFRVGSVRYKMDATRRTLQRILDEESSCSLADQSGKDVKKSSVPKRLVIGDHEYGRIGNGYQLIRDPKKRKRILANEKVRWSLHTARLCLARKNKYCQFFTRFGKCNRGNGKCPYIHDPEKIAVCTKFLKASCSDSNCKLTHKVIPERMQDCLFFLQGLCSNETCPYRHVNVNPNASICEGFLKGYCADGNECRKKHSYVCPIFESTGTCPQGSKCKLHHPKNQNKGTRREPCREKNNLRGRYFGSKHISVGDTKVAVSNKRIREDDDEMFIQKEGKLADFIPLDFSDEEEGEEVFDSALEQKSSLESQPIGKDIDDLIKPVALMKRNVVKKS